jgi:hypothetical protein
MKIETEGVPTQLQIAKVLGISERTVRTLVAEGNLTKGAKLPQIVSEWTLYRVAKLRHG